MPASSRPTSEPLRLFLDAGVLIDGFFNRWGSCKGVLILAALRAQFQTVIAESIGDEVTGAVERKVATLPDDEAWVVRDAVMGWFKIAQPLWLPWPSEAEMFAHKGLLAVVRHRNDMPSVVSAVLARPDWVLSTNTDHWNQELAARTGLRIATPFEFLRTLEPQTP